MSKTVPVIGIPVRHCTCPCDISSTVTGGEIRLHSSHGAYHWGVNNMLNLESLVLSMISSCTGPNSLNQFLECLNIRYSIQFTWPTPPPFQVTFLDVDLHLDQILSPHQTYQPTTTPPFLQLQHFIFQMLHPLFFVHLRAANLKSLWWPAQPHCQPHPVLPHQRLFSIPCDQTNFHSLQLHATSSATPPIMYLLWDWYLYWLS